MRRIGGCWAAATVLLLAAFFLRVFRLDLQAATGDDAFSLMIAQHSLAGIVQLAQHELHPPLFYFMLHGWQPLAGTTEYAGRFLAAGCGLLAVAAIFRLALALGGKPLGLAALLLATINPYLILFAQQVRAYPQLIGLLAISAYCQWQLLRRPSSVWRWVAYVAVTVLALYSHLFASFVLLAEDVLFLIVVLSRRSPRRITWRWIASQAAVGLVYIPWLSIDRAALQTYGNDLVKAVSLPTMALALIPPFLGGLSNPRAWWQIGLASLLLLAGLLGWALRRARGLAPQGFMLLACWLLVPVLAVYFISFARPIFYERYLVIVLPAFLLSVAAGALTLGRVWTPLGLGALAALCAPALLVLPGYYGKVVYASSGDVRQLLDFVQGSSQPDSAFVVNLPPSDPMYLYYAPAEPTFFIPNPASGQQDATNQQLAKILGDHREVWLTPWDYDHTAFVEHWLDQHAFRVDQHWFSNAEIIRYERPRQAGQSTASGATFVAPDAHIRISGYQFFGADVRAGQPVLFQVEWQTDAPISDRYKVFAHLADAQGHVVTQRDDEPVANTRPTTSWKQGETIADNYGLVVPRGAASGTYQVLLGLYKLEGGQRLMLADGTDHTTLGPITVGS